MVICMTGKGKRAINTEYIGFCGWDKILSTTNTLDQTTKSLFATIFETGGRATEVLSLRKTQFQEIENRGIVLIRGMKVLKHGKPAARTFPIRMDDKLYQPMMEAVRESKDYLFPYKYRWLYNRIAGINKYEGQTFGEWFPHRIRAERASQLVVDNGFGVIDLMGFFNWKNSEMPTFYAKLSPEDLIRKMLEGKI